MRLVISYHALPLAFMVAGLVAVCFFMKPAVAKGASEPVTAAHVLNTDDITASKMAPDAYQRRAAPLRAQQ